MKKVFILLVFLSVVLAQNFLNVSQPFRFDENNFFEIRAKAGYFINEKPYCYNTNVSAFVNGREYELRKLIDCYYSVFIRLPDGNYTVTVRASYPDGGIVSRDYELEVIGTKQPEIVLYSPKPLSVFKQGSSVFVEAQALLSNDPVGSSANTSLVDEKGEDINSVVLSKTDSGTFQGTILLNSSEEGDYYLRISVGYDGSVVFKDFPISLIPSESELNQTGPVPFLRVLYPSNELEVPKNSTVLLQVEFKDSNGLTIQSAEVTGEVFKADKLVKSFNMTESLYSYNAEVLFETPGRYVIIFHAVKNEMSDSKKLVLLVGNESERAEGMNFSVRIISPTPGVYAVDSKLNVIARVTVNRQPVSEASVVFYFDGREIAGEYEGNGEYGFTTPELAYGVHSLKTVAEYEDMMAEDYLEFMASDSFLNISPINPDPNQTLYVVEKEQIRLKIDVLDQDDDVVPGAEVTARIIEPNGREVETLLIQNEDTGVYESVFYPSLSGVYKISLKAEKPGFVGDSEEYSFSVELKTEKLVISFHDLLTVLLVLGIIILVVLLLKIVF